MKKVMITALVILAAAQVAVVAMMIMSQERAIEKGTVYHFETRPVDPYDLMRGKYITLWYDRDEMIVADSTFRKGQEVYITFTKNEKGFAVADQVYHNAPAGHAYLSVPLRGSHRTDNGDWRIYWRYPFNRYYMEEGKALDAENLYREASRLQEMDAYSVVSLYHGTAVLTDVQIDGRPIRELVIEMQQDASTEGQQ